MNQVKLSNGKVATSFIADDNSPLAIVHLSVIKFLADMLPSASVESAILNMVARLRKLTTNNVTLDEYVAVLKAEVAFHESINLIREYDPNKKELDLSGDTLIVFFQPTGDYKEWHSIEIPAMTIGEAFQYCQHGIGKDDYDTFFDKERSMMVGDIIMKKSDRSHVWQIAGLGYEYYATPRAFIDDKIGMDDVMVYGLLFVDALKEMAEEAPVAIDVNLEINKWVEKIKPSTSSESVTYGQLLVAEYGNIPAIITEVMKRVGRFDADNIYSAVREAGLATAIKSPSELGINEAPAGANA